MLSVLIRPSRAGRGYQPSHDNLRDLDGTVHYVPHGDIKRVSNLSMDFARINLNVRVTYQTRLEKLLKSSTRLALNWPLMKNGKTVSLKHLSFSG